MEAESSREDHTAFLRWQEVRIAHFGHVVNLVLTLTTAALGFTVSLIVEKQIATASPSMILSLVFLCLAFLAGLATNWSRLCDFRFSALAARARELHERDKAGVPLDEEDRDKAAKRKLYSEKAQIYGIWSWCLLKAQLWLFVVGVVLLAASVMYNYLGC